VGRSRSRLELKVKRLGLVSVSGLRVSFTSLVSLAHVNELYFRDCN